MMMMMMRSVLVILCLGVSTAAAAKPPAAPDSADKVEQAVQQLRDSIGTWNVVTKFLKEDGTVAKWVTGTYTFAWVLPDRVVSGKSEIPELKQISALLFYVNPAKRKIEMASVGADGMLWIMTGDAGSEVRTSQEFATADGGKGQLRFTRFNVTKDRFESKMEWTGDGGKTWKPGNHQVFKRAT